MSKRLALGMPVGNADEGEGEGYNATKTLVGEFGEACLGNVGCTFIQWVCSLTTVIPT